MKGFILKRIFGSLLLLFSFHISYSQCGPGTPTFTVDLTGNPGGTYFSPTVVRNDNCCGTSNPDRCIKFIITLDPGAVGINFYIASGAVPPGALFYQIACGPPIAVGEPICLSGPGPHVLTFCKPGNNQNVYAIESIPGAASGPDIIINDGCVGDLTVVGLQTSTITWNSIFPGTSGQYNNYLSCTAACDFTTVNAQPGYPPFVDYLVCGTSTAPCATGIICDTVRVTFNPTLFVNIVPVEPTVCFGFPTTTFTATGSGGTPPYNYIWNTGATTATIAGGVGTYTVLLGDVSGCPPVSATVTVTSFPSTITANAGSDIVACGTSPTATLNGTVGGTTTGVWTGGNGVFVPNNTTLNATYTPTAAEIAAGSVTLTLNTTNNGSCPPASDQVTITYTTFTTTLTTTTTMVSCNGGTNGTATVNTSGGFAPVSYSWNTTPVQTGITATGLAAGTYTVTVTDVNGCFGTTTATVTEPFALISNTQQDNVLCNGGASGSAFVQVFGGTLPFNYSWSPSGATTPSADNLANGTHIVTITDGNNCIHRDTVIISQPLPLALNITNTNVSCFGGNDGTATANISGGILPYVFDWSSSSTAQTATGLLAGNYTLTVTDDNGCTISDNVTITEPLELIVTVTPVNVSCFGLNDGSATSSVTGGTVGYTYDWDPGSGASVSGLAPGNYILSVTDLLGCEELVPFVITEPPVLDVTIAAQSNVACFGGSDGSASIAVTGGTLSYNYSWSVGGSTTSTATGFPAGPVTATVTDGNGCTDNVAITITEPAAPLTGTHSVTDVSCNGGSNGAITVTPAGGTPGYEIFWTFNGATTLTVSGLQGGNYTYILTDDNGCTFTNTATVIEAPPLSLIPSVVNSVCAGNNGSASVAASGGAGGYSYVWLPNVSSSSSATNIFAGSYLIYVTDAAGCMDSTIANVNDISSAVGTFSNPTDVSCFGGSDGSVTLNIVSGNPSFSFLWSPSGSVAQNPVNLSAGANTVEITDGNGCLSYFTVIISQPTPLTLAMQATPVTCFGGSDGTATAFVTGGTPNYSYAWTPAAGVGSTGTGFSVGNAAVTVTDDNGCTISGSIPITQPIQTSVIISASTDVSCFGGSDGTATAQGQNGVGTFTYLWMPGSIAGQTASGLSAGIYTVTATDGNGCTSSTTVTIGEPAAPLSVTFTTTPTSCFNGTNGTATAIPAGGTSGYFYNWTTGSQTNQTASNLPAGSHFVVVTDALGCTTSGIATVTQPAELIASVITGSTTCGNTNGNASVQVNGGITPYNYLWTPSGFTTSVITNVASGPYSVLVTDDNGCTTTAAATIINIPGPIVAISGTSDVTCFGGANGSASVTISSGTPNFQITWLPSGGSGLTATGLPAGSYSVTITDANGCQAFTGTTIDQPTLLNPSILSTTHVSCNGLSDGAITSTTTGGSGGNTFSWSPSGGSGQNASGLSAGIYTLTVTDQNGCVSSASTTITEPPVLTLAVVNAIDPLCFGGSDGEIEVIAGGGTPVYSYSWTTIPVQITSTATGLSLGTYTAIVTDDHGCQESVTATLNQPTQVTVSSSPNDSICIGQSAVVTASASGGSGTYLYSWDPFLGPNASYTVTPSQSTTYTVTAYDNFGCQSSTSSSSYIEVYVLNNANFIVDGYSPICPGGISNVFATATGNIGDVTYTWNQALGTGPGSFAVTPAVPTWYVCTVTNTCGLSVTDSVLVDISPLPTADFTSDLINGCAPLLVTFNDQSITNTTDSIYSYQWVFGDGGTSTALNPTYLYQNSGEYYVTLTVTTYGGCSGTSGATDYMIDVFPVPVAAFSVNQTELNIPGDVVVCTNQSVGAISSFWNFGDGYTTTDTHPSHEYSNVGDLIVTLLVTNIDGCTDTASITLDVVSDLEFPNAFTPNTSGGNGGTYSFNDMNNDVFYPYTTGTDNFKMWIFNRWGELIFETNDINIGWDGYYRGVLCEQGVYVWKAEVVFEDGRKYNKVGDVTLLR